jgi:hypothetical protein
MKYSEQLRLSSSWILSVRNPDYGWGLNSKQASSIVNTAEALYVLNKAKRLPKDLDKSVQFLRDAIAVHPTKRGQYLRYYAFCILGLISANISPNNPSIQFCVKTIHRSQISNKGWGNSLDDTTPRVFPTFLALWSLQMVEQQPSLAAINGLEWLLTIQKRDGGWGFTDDPNEKSNIACTAYALIVLKNQYSNDKRVQRGKNWLTIHYRDIVKTPIVGESIGGTDWHHSNTIWAMCALLDYGETVFSPIVLDITLFLNELFDSQNSGWRETKNHVVNIRSIFWAVLALDKANNLLDLNDLPAEISTPPHMVGVGVKGIGVYFSRQVFVPLVLSGCILFVAAYILLYQSNSSLLLEIPPKVARIITTIVLGLGCITLWMGRRQITRFSYWLSLVVIIGTALVLWLVENTSFVNTLAILSFFLTLIPLISEVLRNKQTRGCG